jgi:AcrR family transcriptional regulator
MRIRSSTGGGTIIEDVAEDAKTPAKEDRRQQIMDAALAVFSKKGYGEATIPGIAGEAGVAVGTIYHYYESKHDLLVSLIDNYVKSDALREIFAELAKEDDRTSVQGIIENGLDWAADDLKGFLFIFTEVLRDPELGEHFSEKFLASLLQSLEKYMAERVSSVHFRQVDPKVAARALFGMVLGFVLLRQLEGGRGTGRTAPLPEETAQLADIFLEGVRDRGS